MKSHRLPARPRRRRLPRRRLHHHRRRRATAAPPPAPPSRRAPATPTAAEADAFVARAERELAEFAVINARAQWVNATYITQDTDALAAHFGTIGTEMGGALRQRGGALPERRPASAPTRRRKLNILRSGLTLPAPTTAGAAAELNRISTDLQSQYGRGRGTMNGQPLTGNEIEARMGTVRNPDAAQGDVDELEQQCRRADAPAICAHDRDRQRQGAASSAFPTPARCGAPNTTCRPTSSRR